MNIKLVFFAFTSRSVCLPASNKVFMYFSQYLRCHPVNELHSLPVRYAFSSIQSPSVFDFLMPIAKVNSKKIKRVLPCYRPI
jgi:hypothetical protein